jgi:elongation factor G
VSVKDVKVSDTRNFALVGHAGDGKTSLGEAILHAAGATHGIGSVTEGTSVLNHLPEEQERHTTISSAIYAFDANDQHHTLVDTPGDSNFQADGQIALRALDGAVLTLSGVDGAKVGTNRMFRFCREHDIPLVAFVNGMDRERADLDRALDSLVKMDAKPVAVTLPVGAQEALSGVIDLLEMKVHGADGAQDIPAELADEAAAAREKLVDAIAECDDALLEKYLEEGELSAEEISAGLVKAARAGELLPVLCGAALSEVGIGRLLWAIQTILPSAAERGPWRGRDDTEVAADADAPFSALVLKTSIDRYAGTLSVFRVVTGRITSDSSILNGTTGDRERLSKLFLLQGAEHVDVPEAGPGDIVAVAKLKSVHTGHVLTAEKAESKLREIPIPEGVISYAIQAKSKGEEDKVFTSLGRLVEEDPTLQLGRDASTGEFLLTGSTFGPRSTSSSACSAWTSS